MVGFDGQELTPDLEEMINKYKVGGIIYFARNIESLNRSSGFLKRYRGFL